jgi:hypothetical protein
MKTKVSSSPGSPAPSAPGATPVAPKFTPRGAKKNRILVAVVDGKIDFAGMSPEASKELNELLHSPDVQQQFNIGPLAQKFDPQHCMRLYQALGRVIATGTRVGLGWSPAAAEKMEYSQKECEELAKPTAAVLDQFGNRFLQENQSVIALALVFAAITQNKFQEALRIQAIEKAKNAAPGPTPRGPAIVPPNKPPIAVGMAERRPIG